MPNLGKALSRIALTVAISVSIPRSVLAQIDLSIMAPAVAGGGWDSTARVMQRALMTSGIARSVQVTNVPGSGGSAGLIRFVKEAKGDGSRLMITGFAMVGSVILNRTPVTLDRITPIARLTSETQALAVPARSAIKDAKHLAALLKVDPSSVIWGGGSVGGADHTTAALFAATVGTDTSKLNWVPFAEGDREVAALLEGRLTVGISGYGTFDRQIRAGHLRLIGIAAAGRKPGIPGPTLGEQGIDLVIENWRAVVAAPGISAKERTTLVDAIDRMARSSAWAEALKQKSWDDAYLGGDAFTSFLKAEQARIEDVFSSLGLVK